MRVDEFDYSLPRESIAITPPKQRGKSRLLVLKPQLSDRRSRNSNYMFEHRNYGDLVDYLKPGDLIVLNDTRVIKARLFATDSRGRKRELMLLERHKNNQAFIANVLYRGNLKIGETLSINNYNVIVQKIVGNGIAIIKSDVSWHVLAEQAGTVPLPPYLHRMPTNDDIDRYQTEFAKYSGSVAAPTASLNFTKHLTRTLKEKGVNIAYVTLHVGLGTFLPIRASNLEEHQMHSEYFSIPKNTVDMIINTRNNGGSIVAIGTTVTRTLEYAADDITHHSGSDIDGEANIFIFPGYKFKLVDIMLTNFHAPKSTVLMMAAAFTGWDNLKEAYRIAIDNNYKFLSYGDSMLILGNGQGERT